MKEFLWRVLAHVLSFPIVANWLIAYAKRTKYEDIEGYMERDWVFNPYREDQSTEYEWCETSARVHHILRPDNARDPHNHPRGWRTIVLKGWYLEERDDGEHLRCAGDTAALDANEFHRITRVSAGGVYTLFITGPYVHQWGFRLPDGSFVKRREYQQKTGYTS